MLPYGEDLQHAEKDGENPMPQMEAFQIEAEEPRRMSVATVRRRQSLAAPLARSSFIHSLTPDKQWSEKWLAISAFAVLYTVVFALCVLHSVSFDTLRVSYSVVGLSLLIFRFVYYLRHGWILYFIDLCFIVSLVLITSLWILDSCPTEWLIAMYVVPSGPVAGSTFLLNIPLTFHHPDAFESFFMHASPMWVCEALRWRHHLFARVARRYDVGELIWIGLSRFYIWWWLFYLLFLLAHPMMPVLSEYETLMDGVVFPHLATPEARLAEKRANYGRYCLFTLGYTLAHAIMSVSGFAAAALSFQYWAIQILWIILVQIGGIQLGIHFYHASHKGSSEAWPGIVTGLLRMLVAWVILIPAYFIVHCHPPEA